MVEEVSEKVPNRLVFPRGSWADMVVEDEENTGKTEEEEISGKADERSSSPGGTWAEMVKHSRINPTHVSTGQSSSQESQKTIGLGPS